MYVRHMVFVFFYSPLSAGRGFLLALSAAVQASLPWVHYACMLVVSMYTSNALVVHAYRDGEGLPKQHGTA